MYFKKEKKRLNKHLLELANNVERQLGNVLKSLNEGDVSLANRIINDDSDIGDSSVQVEEECLKILALYQPVANDLRFIVSILKINSALERIADHAVIMAKEVVIMANNNNKILASDNLLKLSELTKMMLRKSLLAWVEEDILVAEDVLSKHTKKRDLAEDIYNEHVEKLKANVGDTEQYLSLIKIADRLERISKQALYIAEDYNFMVNGEVTRHNGTY